MEAALKEYAAPMDFLSARPRLLLAAIAIVFGALFIDALLQYRGGFVDMLVLALWGGPALYAVFRLVEIFLKPPEPPEETP